MTLVIFCTMALWVTAALRAKAAVSLTNAKLPEDNPLNFVVAPNAEFFCEQSTILNGTEYGITLATAEDACQRDPRCSFISLRRPEVPVASYAWLCSGNDWMKRTPVDSTPSGEVAALVAIDLKRTPLKNYDLEGNISGECSGGPLEASRGFYDWDQVGRSCDANAGCQSFILNLAPPAEPYLAFCSSRKVVGKKPLLGSIVGYRQQHAPRPVGVKSHIDLSHHRNIELGYNPALSSRSQRPMLPNLREFEVGSVPQSISEREGPIVSDHYNPVYAYGTVVGVPDNRK